MDYPHFVPPGDLATIDPRDWTLAQAQVYRDWLAESLDRRVDALLAFAGVSGRSPSERLGSMGRWIGQQMATDTFTELVNGARRLNDRGFALAADAGLAVARELINHHPGIRWQILTLPQTDTAYHLPVLTGFRKDLHMDPIGGSIAEAYELIGGDVDDTVWLETYERWSRNARPDGSTPG